MLVLNCFFKTFCRFKFEQIPQIAAQSVGGSTVTVYRMGDHTDISRGPMMASTDHIIRYNITAVSCCFCGGFGYCLLLRHRFGHGVFVVSRVSELGELIATWLSVRTFSQVVMMFASELKGHGFNPRW